MAEMDDYQKQQLQEAVAALRTNHYTPNNSDLQPHSKVEHNSNVSVKLADGLDGTESPPTQATTSNVRPHQDLIDGQLLEAVTSASAVDKANTLVQLRNAVEEHQVPRSASFERQSRMAEQAVSLLSPVINQSKRRKRSVDQGSDVADDANEVPDDAPIDLRIQDESVNKKQRIEDNNNHHELTQLTSLCQHHQPHQPNPSDQLMPPHQPIPPPVAAPPEEDNVFVSEYPQNSTALSEARIAAGIYSAAALFRKPNTMTKKYTRPPMSKLFADLELTPESFLQLQAQAKNYMLEEAHPERRDCVGNRAKGDTDMNKLKLFHCVREFLEPGLGTFYFGPSSEGSNRRKWSWPKDFNEVIAAVTPLLRRMVTNERQREYANESRRTGGKKKSEKRTSPVADATGIQENGPRSLDPMLGYGTSIGDDNSTEIQQPDESADTLILHFIVIDLDSESNQRHIVARFECPASMCATFTSLQSYVYTATAVTEAQAAEPGLSHTATYIPTVALPSAPISDTTGQEAECVPAGSVPVMPSISAFLPSSGLWVIRNEVDWSNAVEEARKTVWMEQILKVVVETQGRA